MFQYVLNEESDEPIMLLNKHLGYDDEEGQGIDCSLFQSELLQLDQMGKKRIQVWINCPGGVVVEGYNICSAILKTNTPVDTYNLFMAASMGGVIFMCGRNRVMNDYSILMVHPPSGSSDAKVYNAFMDSLSATISAKSNVSKDDVKSLMAKTTWIGADECLAKGFCTKIEHTRDLNQKGMPLLSLEMTPEFSDMKAVWKKEKVRVETIVNSILNKNINNNLNPRKMANWDKITAKLQLVDGANEEAVLEAIKRIEDRANKAEKELSRTEEVKKNQITDIQNKLEKERDDARAEAKIKGEEETKAKDETIRVKDQLSNVQNSLSTKTKDYDDIKGKFDVLQKEKDDAVTAQRKTQAETLVDKHQKVGRVKNETKDQWIKLAIENFADTEKMLEAIPLNGKAPVVSDMAANKLVEGETPTTAMNLAVRNKLIRDGKMTREGKLIH